MADTWSCDDGDVGGGYQHSVPPVSAFELDVFEPSDEGFIDQQEIQHTTDGSQEGSSPWTLPAQSPPRKRMKPNPEDIVKEKDDRLRRVLLSDAHPISQLHQSGLNVAFQFIGAQGPSHEPLFTFSCTLDGVLYEGVGASKKQAKENAARRAVTILRVVLGLDKAVESDAAEIEQETDLTGICDVPTVDQPPVQSEESKVDVTATEQEAEAPKPVEPSLHLDPFHITSAYRISAVAMSPETIETVIQSIHVMTKSNSAKLHSLMLEVSSTEDPCTLAERIGLLLGLTSSGTECSPDCQLPEGVNRLTVGFTYCFRLAEEAFYGMSVQKKAAKHAAGAQALNWLLDIIPVVWRIVQVPRQLQTVFSADVTADASRARNFASEVCLSVYEKLNGLCLKYAGSSLLQNVDHNSLAAICLSQAGLVRPLVMATGSSVIYRKNLSSRGRTLKDCQAETLVLRGFKRYLLGQVALFLEGKGSVFHDDVSDGKLCLKSDVGFHLFLTHTPSGRCFGQGAVKYDEAKPDLAVPGPASGTFQCTTSEVVDCRDTVKSDENFYDDIVTGHEKLKIMASSDKLLKKLVVGLQGDLLSVFAHPIFLQTICMRGNDKLVNMASGLYERLLPVISTQSGSSSEFPLVCPEICGTVPLENLDENSLKHPIPLKAFVWVVDGDSDQSDVEEFLDTSTGLTVSGKLSELCKKNLGLLFSVVAASCCETKNTAAWADLKTALATGKSYGDLKHLAPSYRTKMDFFRDTSKSLGHWVSKCLEEEQFIVIEADGTV